MADDYPNDMTTAAHGETEPATKHDVTEGGVIGAVGGAVVGLLAGGPLGAIIGAVAGGVASAAAVDVVDKHDHDYARTTADHRDDFAADENDLNDPERTLRGDGTGYKAVAPGTEIDDRAGASGTADTTAYETTAGARVGGATDQVVVPVVEEELTVGKREVQRGGAHIRTDVIETPVEEQVLLREETVTVDRHPVNRTVTDADRPFQEGIIEVEEIDEVPIVTKEARVVEEVVVGKTATDRTETIRDTVRRTDVQVDQVDGTETARDRRDL